MSTSEKNIRLDMTKENTVRAIQKIANDFKWQVLELGEEQVVLGYRIPLGTKTIKLSIQIRSASEGKSDLHIVGALFLVIPKKHIDIMMGQLINALSLEVQASKDPKFNSDVSGELEKLIDLFQKGHLSKEEFEKAKSKVLGF